MSQHAIPATTVLWICTGAPIPLTASTLSTIIPAEPDAAPELRIPAEAAGGVLCRSGEHHCAIFSTAGDALAGACAIQHNHQALGSQAPLHMALHTGSIGQAGNAYFGATIQRGFALLAATHPGQIVLSQDTRAALGETQAYQMHELGMHRLTDLLAPEYLFQLVCPGHDAPMLPLMTLHRFQTNLPVQPTPFIGHTKTVQQACQMIADGDSRLLTVVASSGTGKTRFSLEVGVQLLNKFPDGVYFVALAPVNDANIVIAQLAQTLGISEVAHEALINTLTEYLSSRRALLILDNFEQVLAAAKPIASLLAETEHLRMIVTSHVPLRVPEEQVLHLPPLDLPNPTRIPSLALLAEYDSVRLFIERAQAVLPAFTLTEENAPDVAAICARLSGLPLALELVAAYLDTSDPATLHTQLGSYRYRGLTLPEVLRWTYERLPQSTRKVFARLGIFAGGCTREAAQTICVIPRDRNLDVPRELDNLARKNLLFPEALYGSDTRYIMLDCIHDYARECLVAQEEVGPMARQHGTYYLELAERGNAGLYGEQQKTWLTRLDGERHNLRAAFHWAVAHNDAEAIVRLTAALGRYWHLRGAFTEGSSRVETALGHLQKVSLPLRAAIYNIATFIYGEMGKYEGARFAAEQSVALSREAGDSLGVIKALSNLAAISQLQGDMSHAKTLYLECLELARTRADQRQQALMLNNLGEVALEVGEFAEAQGFLDQALEIMRSVHEPVRAIELTKALGWLAHEQGDRARAATLFAEGLAYCRDLGGHSQMPTLLEGCAAASEGARCARLLGAAEALREADGRPVPPNEHERYTRIVETLRGQIEAGDLRNAWMEGRAMAWEQAIAFALHGR